MVVTIGTTFVPDSFATAQHDGQHVILEAARDQRVLQLELPIGPGRDPLRFEVLPGPAAPGVQSIAGAARQGRPTRADSGHELLFLGRPLRLVGVACPATDTDDGRAAKALLTTLLRRSGYFRCDALRRGGVWDATCTVADQKGAPAQQFAQILVQSGLCTAEPIGLRDQ